MNFLASSRKSVFNLTTALVAKNAYNESKKLLVHGRLEIHIHRAEGTVIISFMTIPVKNFYHLQITRKKSKLMLFLV